MVSKDKKTTMALVGGGTRSLSDLKQPCDSDALKVYGSGGGHSGLLVHDVDAICNQAMEIGFVAEGTVYYRSSVPSAPLQVVPRIRKGEKRHGPADYTKTVYVIGFDCSSPGLHKTKRLMMETFGKCGEISRVHVPYNHRTQRGMGIAYVQFSSADGFNKALELDGIKLGDVHLLVKPTIKGAFRRGLFGGGDNGPDGCFGDSSKGGRGTPVKPRTVTFGTGKKTTFDD